MSANGKPTSAVEYVRGLSPEEKGDVFIALLRELIETYGGTGLIPVETPDGESLGYYVPPMAAEARAEAVLPRLTPEEWAELEKQMDEPGIPIDEVIADLKAQAAAYEKKKRESCEAPV